jgi:hypothetical protein
MCSGGTSAASDACSLLAGPPATAERRATKVIACSSLARLLDTTTWPRYTSHLFWQPNQI